MKAVIDTNVLVSAQLNPHGTPAAILRAWRDARFELVTSAVLIEEFRGVMAQPRILRRVASPEQIDAFLIALAEVMLEDEPAMTLDVIANDPADNRVLEAAVASEADYIVSGDDDLLSLERYAQIPIVRPAQFLAILAVSE